MSPVSKETLSSIDEHLGQLQVSTFEEVRWKLVTIPVLLAHSMTFSVSHVDRTVLEPLRTV